MRVCDCGCGASLEGRRRNARYASDACRTTAWRARTGYRLQAVRKPSQNGNVQRVRPPDMRISYMKAVEEIVAYYYGGGPWTEEQCREWGHEILRPLLTERQREHLDKRDG